MRFLKISVFFSSTVLLAHPVLADDNRCLDRFHACRDIGECLGPDTDLNDIRRIKEGAASGNGHLVWEGADACWTNKGHHENWATNSRGCTDPDYAREARKAISNAC